MDLMVLLDKLEDILASGNKMPLTSYVMLNEDKVLTMIEEIREAVPAELKQARWIIRERQDMLEEAEKESARLLDDAKEKASTLANEMEIVKLAEKQAADVLDNARAREREITMGAEDYADELLANLEVNLGKVLSAIQRNRDRLQGKIELRP